MLARKNKETIKMAEDDSVVGIGEICVAHNPKCLNALGLGSCVAVALYDKENHIGGLAHVMLPSSKEYSGKIEKDRTLDKLSKYADVAIPETISKMERIGAKKQNIRAKISGGAQMFPGLSNDLMNIGARNIESVKRTLKESCIPLDAEDVGGNCGRSIRFDIADQKLKIKTINGEKEI